MAKNSFVPELTEFFGEFVRCLGCAYHAIESPLPRLSAEERERTLQAAREELHRVDTMLAKLISGAPVEKPMELFIEELKMLSQTGQDALGRGFAGLG